jgi:putative endonuclease
MAGGRDFFVYILANRSGPTYVGMSSNLVRRVWQHRERLVPGYTRERNIRRLVYYEHIEDPYTAVSRERQIKKWNRVRKAALVEKMNPTWRDLFPDLMGGIIVPAVSSTANEPLAGRATHRSPHASLRAT